MQLQKKKKKLFKKQNIFSFCKQKDKEQPNIVELSVESSNEFPYPQFSINSQIEGTSVQTNKIIDVEENSELKKEHKETIKTSQAVPKKGKIEASLLQDNFSNIAKEHTDQLLSNQLVMIEMLKQISSHQKPDIKREEVETSETKETIIDHSEETQEFFTKIRIAKSMKYILNNK